MHVACIPFTGFEKGVVMNASAIHSDSRLFFNPRNASEAKYIRQHDIKIPCRLQHWSGGHGLNNFNLQYNQYREAILQIMPF